jgi:hypothetical protein
MSRSVERMTRLQQPWGPEDSSAVRPADQGTDEPPTPEQRSSVKTPPRCSSSW